MLCSCCVKLVRILMENNNIKIKRLHLGLLQVDIDKNVTRDKIKNILHDNDFEIIEDKEKILLEQIKITVIELIHELNNVNSIIRKSDYLVEKLGMPYQKISKIFSANEPITLERFIILNKIEKIKQMIIDDEYSLFEISYLMDYNSVHYLSNQFKKEVGITISEFKKLKNKPLKSLDKLY